MWKTLTLATTALALVACSGSKPDEATADIAATPQSTAPDGATLGYSAERTAYFGDMHIHTRNSFDAYI
ncbi:MAG: hypothetical protein ACI93G_001945, partial [Hyphomonas sp.]